MNIPSAEIRKDEDLIWYISIHKETTFCVSFLKTDNLTFNTTRDADFQAPLFCSEGRLWKLIAPLGGRHVPVLFNNKCVTLIVFY